MRYTEGMRTTLELDDELVATAKQMAREKGMTMGQVISDLATQSLKAKAKPRIRNGVILFEPVPGAPRADMELVNRLRDEE
jgi:hypothetical protein